jgi:hypothetical protein
VSKEDSVRERDNIRFATPPPLPTVSPKLPPPTLVLPLDADAALDELCEKSKSPERSLAGFLGVNGSIESVEEEDGRVGSDVSGLGADFWGVLVPREEG